MTAALTPSEAVAMLERLLSTTPFRSLPDAKAIDLDLDGERFFLDPRRSPLTGAGSCAHAALVLRCRARTLVGLFTEPDFVLGKGDELAFAGDPAALGPVIAALSGGSNRLNVMIDRLKKK
jgi:hypothetical protein